MKLAFYFSAFIVFVGNIQNGKFQQSKPVVTTDFGNIQGTENQTIGQNVTYYAFRGIPFAKPPVGDLRFEAPVPAEPWNGTLDGTNDKSQCVQSKTLGSEDCLYLNVYTPKLPSNNGTLLPVMVYIYGGTFTSGNSSYVSFGPDYFLEKGVVYAAMNYRVGLFGFGSTGDSVMPGNNGLKDQLLALKWINAHIASFGGNNKKITLFGESAGSVSVSYHLQSNKSKGLFHGAIMQSGTSLCLWGLTRKAKSFIFSVGERLLLNTTNSQSLKNDLKKVDFEKIATISDSVNSEFVVKHNPKNGLFIGPVSEPEHDDAFFTGKSHELLSKGDFNQVPTIVGFNSMEANTDMTIPIRVFLLKYDLNVTALPPIDMNLKNITDYVTIGNNIKQNYFETTPIFLSSDFQILQFITDDQFVRPIRETVLELTKYSKVFFYSFQYEGILGGVKDRTVPGVAHAEELSYLFRQYRNSTKQDQLVRNIMVTMWTNFAKYKNPTPRSDPILQNITWVAAQSNERNITYLEIDDSLKMNFNPESKNMTYWDELYKNNATRPYDTY